jgi:hypothetical protein
MDVICHNPDLQDLRPFPDCNRSEVVAQKASDASIDQRRAITSGPDQVIIEAACHAPIMP